jgi:hypothetical protein
VPDSAAFDPFQREPSRLVDIFGRNLSSRKADKQLINTQVKT